MKISKEKAVKVFEYFGFKTASKWNAKKMTDKLTTILESIDPKVKIKSKKVKALVQELLAADSIVVVVKKKGPESEETLFCCDKFFNFLENSSRTSLMAGK